MITWNAAVERGKPYICHRRTQTDEFGDLSKGSFDDHYYIEEREAIPANIDTWDFSDGKMRIVRRNDIEPVENIIEDFLNKPITRFLFIGAPFGIGKTSGLIN